MTADFTVAHRFSDELGIKLRFSRKHDCGIHPTIRNREQTRGIMHPVRGSSSTASHYLDFPSPCSRAHDFRDSRANTKDLCHKALSVVITERDIWSTTTHIRRVYPRIRAPPCLCILYDRCTSVRHEVEPLRGSIVRHKPESPSRVAVSRGSLPFSRSFEIY